MINAGTVTAYLTLDTAGFDAGILAAGEALTRFRNEQTDGIAGVGAMLGGLGTLLLSGLEKLVDSIGSSPALAALPSVLFGKGALAIDGLIGGVMSRQGVMLGAAQTLMNTTKNAVGSVSFTPVGYNIVTGIMAGMNARRGTLFAAAQSMASGVSDVIRAALKIHSPSQVMMEIGAFTAKGMELGLMGGAEGVYDAALSMSRETAELLAGASAAGGTSYDAYRAAGNGEKWERLLETLEKLVYARSTVEIDGRPFGRLVKEYV